MKLKFFPLLVFAFFCLGGGFVYLSSLSSGKVGSNQRWFVETTAYFWMGLMVECFGVYLIRYSLVFANSVKGIAILLAGFLFIMLGWMWIEQLL